MVMMRLNHRTPWFLECYVVGFWIYTAVWVMVLKKTTRKTWFLREKIRLVSFRYKAKFCLVALFEINEITIVFSWEIDVKMGKTMVSIQNLERNVVANLATGKILRSNQVWRTESRLSLLMKNNIIHVEKYSYE